MYICVILLEYYCFIVGHFKNFSNFEFLYNYTAFSILTLLLQHYQLLHEKQVMYFNQQHSALEVCFVANIVYFEIVVI